jgi:subtilisin-like proprotein convertase family protein
MAVLVVLIAQSAAAQPARAVTPPPPLPDPWPSFASKASGPADLGLDIPPNCLGSSAGAGNFQQQAIPDGGVITTTVQVTQSVPYAFMVGAFTFISHTNPSDLVINLISPDGTQVTLANHRGLDYADTFAQTLWIDFGSVPVTEENFNAPPQPNYLIPEQAMGAFQGKQATGVWKLVVADTNNNGHTGFLNLFGVIIIRLNEVPIMTTAHFSQTTPVILSDQGDFDSQLLVNVPESPVITARLTTNITHPKPRQLNIQLESPQPVSTTISNGNGGFFLTNFPNWFAGTVWEDKAGDTYPPGAVTMDQAVYQTSPLTATVPEGAMGHFTGIHPNGPWDLHISDHTPGAGGVLNSWGLDITTGHCLAHAYLPLVTR